jgi:hypothetical protein
MRPRNPIEASSNAKVSGLQLRRRLLSSPDVLRENAGTMLLVVALWPMASLGNSEGA